MPEPYGRLFSAYLDFHRLYLTVVNRTLAPVNLTGRQYAVLKTLHTSEPLPLKMIARRHGVEPPTMTALVKKLENTGHVRLEAGDDKREKYICLTEQGLFAFLKAKEIVDALYQEILSGRGAHEVESGARLFEAMKRNLMSMG